MSGVDEKILNIAWTMKLADYQNWDKQCNVDSQDGTSVIKILRNDRESSGKRARHFDTRLFCAKYLIEERTR